LGGGGGEVTAENRWLGRLLVMDGCDDGSVTGVGGLGGMFCPILILIFSILSVDKRWLVIIETLSLQLILLLRTNSDKRGRCQVGGDFS
jgi:hypothetical protein